MEHFRDICHEDLDQLGITEPEVRSKVLAAVGFVLDTEEFEDSSHHWLENSFIRHTNGRVSLPAGSTHAYPMYPHGVPFTFHPTPEAIENGTTSCQIYENASFLCPPSENNLDHAIHSSSTDNSSGYHSRPKFNIPLTNTTPPPIEALSSAASGVLSPTIHSTIHGARKVSPQVSSSGVYNHASLTPPCEEEVERETHQASNRENHLDAPRDSYRAHVARVHSTPSPTSQTRIDGQNVETKTC